jgi:hypothetical protein
VLPFRPPLLLNLAFATLFPSGAFV